MKLIDSAVAYVNAQFELVKTRALYLSSLRRIQRIIAEEVIAIDAGKEPKANLVEGTLAELLYDHRRFREAFLLVTLMKQRQPKEEDNG